MKFFKKVAAVLVAVSMVVSGLIANVGAASFPKGTGIINSNEPTTQHYVLAQMQTTNYQLPVKCDGYIAMSYVSTGIYAFTFELWKEDDGEFKEVYPTQWTDNGITEYRNNDYLFGNDYKVTFGSYRGSIVWPVSEGTYFVRITKEYGKGDITVNAVYDQTDSKNTKRESDKAGSADLNTFQVTMKKGSSLTLSGLTASLGSLSKSVKWTSSNKSVATVDSKGKIKAKKNGTAVISAKCGDITKKIKIKVAGSVSAGSNVKTASADIKKTSSKAIDAFQVTIKKGTSIGLLGITEDLNAVSQDTEWSTSKKSVATVDSKGNVKATGKGTAVISLKCGSVTKHIKIKVN